MCGKGKLALYKPLLEFMTTTHAQTALTEPYKTDQVAKNLDFVALRDKCASSHRKQEAAAAQTRREQELAHQRKWRLHVVVRETGKYGMVHLYYSFDDAPETSTMISSLDRKPIHIDANDHVTLRMSGHEKPSYIDVTVNGKQLPAGNWKTIKNPDYASEVFDKYVVEIR